MTQPPYGTVFILYLSTFFFLVAHQCSSHSPTLPLLLQNSPFLATHQQFKALVFLYCLFSQGTSLNSASILHEQAQ